LSSRDPLVITIGVFDGVHRGHQALIKKTVQLARRLNAVPAAVTFQDHPMHVLKGGPRIPFLLPRAETFELLRRQGLQRVIALRFTKAFSRKSPEQFLVWLLSQGRIKGIVVGANFRFGRGAKGDVGALKALGKKMGFQVAALSPVRLRDGVVSSSRVRELLMAGKLETASALLGRAYAIEGDVIHGKHVGHKIGFPTANLHHIGQFLPKDGVYACAVKLGKQYYRAGMNLGKRPTFVEDDHHRAAEVHILDYDGKLYGKSMRVYLLKYLRPEKKFPSSSALVGQIERDLKAVRQTSLKGLNPA